MKGHDQETSRSTRLKSLRSHKKPLAHVSHQEQESADSQEKCKLEQIADPVGVYSNSVLSAKEVVIKNWLSDITQPSGVDVMPLRIDSDIPVPKDIADLSTIGSQQRSQSTIGSRKTLHSTTSVYKRNYRDLLQNYNVFIYEKDISVTLQEELDELIFCHRTSPELDEDQCEDLKKLSKRLKNAAEDEITLELGPIICPAMMKIPHESLARKVNTMWKNAIPIPLSSIILGKLTPLPKPKPDLTFGYTRNAFSRHQLNTIDLLAAESGQNNARPHQDVIFPFLVVEFKSQARGGTHHVATNQIASAGAIALQGYMDLFQRCPDTFNDGEPKFFSMTMDHHLVCLNLHWAEVEDNGDYDFHVTEILDLPFKESDGIRSIIRAIKNILDHAAGLRLQNICKALDNYREKVIQARKNANQMTLKSLP